MKDILKNKKRIIVMVIIIVVLIGIWLIININGMDKDKIGDKEEDKDNNNSYDYIYEVFPEEVTELYTNTIDMSCNGDLYLDLELDSGINSIGDMDNGNLLDYVFTYLDKNNKLGDRFDISIVEEASDKLLSKDIDFRTLLDKYQYGDYVYSLKDKVITREKGKCQVGKYYVSQLYGYSHNEELLSVDINMGYVKDNILYDLADNRLGEYNGDRASLENLFGPNSYYRYNFVKDGDNYKLESVEWNSRS